jgi:hypothetical protein
VCVYLLLCNTFYYNRYAIDFTFLCYLRKDIAYDQFIAAFYPDIKKAEDENHASTTEMNFKLKSKRQRDFDKVVEKAHEAKQRQLNKENTIQRLKNETNKRKISDGSESFYRNVVPRTNAVTNPTNNEMKISAEENATTGPFTSSNTDLSAQSKSSDCLFILAKLTEDRSISNIERNLIKVNSNIMISQIKSFLKEKLSIRDKELSIVTDVHGVMTDLQDSMSVREVCASLKKQSGEMTNHRDVMVLWYHSMKHKEEEN